MLVHVFFYSFNCSLHPCVSPSIFLFLYTYVLSVDGNAYVYTRVDLGNTITIQVKAIQYINCNAVAILPDVYW